MPESRVDVYLQRILDHSTNTKGYRFTDLEAKAKEGVPALMMSRTSPKSVGFEQTRDSVLMSDYKDWEFYEQQRPQNVAGAYRLLTASR